MLIEIHAIQNHSSNNLNRDDLGAPKSCFFGNVLRSRISSQCQKRSIRMSDEFKRLLGGVRTRRLAQLIADNDSGSKDFERAMSILKLCGIAPKEKKTKKVGDGDDTDAEDKSAGLVFTTRQAVSEMAQILRKEKDDQAAAKEFAKLIATHTSVPDMALFGRMLEPKKAEKGKNAGGGKKDENVWKGKELTVEAALQVAHAISTHEARPEVDYYVAADDIPGEDAGAGYVDEAMFASACFYKYFSINWEKLVANLKGASDHEKLAAHTVGAFIRGVAKVNPTGKQNSYAAHNPPDGILVEIKSSPTSYANAFAKPVTAGEHDIISESIVRLAHYAHDLDMGYGKPTKRFWFSPNLRYPLTVVGDDKKETFLSENNYTSLDDLIAVVVAAIGHEWKDVQMIVVNPEAA